MSKSIINKIIDKLPQYNITLIIFIFTFGIVLSSVPLVYLLTLVFGVTYTKIIFMMSILAPSFISPPTILLILKLISHLQLFKDELYEEIEKNKAKDILLFEQARFAFMGEMIANISHQWKQPLNTINLAVLNAKLSASSQEEREKYFDIMEQNVEYLAATINDFMSFFDKRENLEMKSLSYIAKEVQDIIGIAIKNKNIDFKVKIYEDLGNVEIASSLSQVILNLLSNAKDAFKPDAVKKIIYLEFLTTEKELEIYCCDNGVGVLAGVQDKIFDPYFTTKEKTKGTGIGLYMSKQIVLKLFEGELGLIAKDNFTTCFKISIPYAKNCVIKKNEDKR
ncbi:MAG: HAMP domain-containing sensor histidine kinase [Sulfurimonas sp.]